MTISVLLLLALLGITLAGTLIQVVVGYLRLRGRRLVACPGTGEPVAVELAAARSTLSASLGQPHLR